MSVPARQQINLFNPAFQPQKVMLTARRMAAVMLVMVAGLVALDMSLRGQTAGIQADADAAAALLARKQARLAAVGNDFAPRQKDPEVAAELARAEARLASLRQVAAQLKGGGLGETTGFAGYFKAFARQSVPNLWLTGVSITGKNIDIKGRTTDPALVPGYISRLTQEPMLQGKSFSSLHIGQAEPVQGVGKDGKPVRTPAPYVEFSLQSLPEGAGP